MKCRFGIKTVVLTISSALTLNANKGTCTVCKEWFHIPKSDTTLTGEDYKYTGGIHWLLYHLDCFKFAEPLQKLNEALANGDQRFCPKWGKGGRKDLECTHMAWTECKTEYCYVWGKSEDEVDFEKNLKENQDPNILARHNVNWIINSKRCPLYFESIYKLDNRWPSTAEESNEFFHRLLKLANLKKFIKKKVRKCLDIQENKLWI